MRARRLILIVLGLGALLLLILDLGGVSVVLDLGVVLL